MIPSTPIDIEVPNGRPSHFHHLARWFYRIVFGFIGLGIFGNVVDGFVQTIFTSGALAIPTLEQVKRTYLLMFALRSPLIFWSATVILVGSGIFGFIVDRRITRAEKIIEEERHRLAGTAAAEKTIEMTSRERLSTRLIQESQELEVFTDEAAVDLLTRLLEGFLHRPLSEAEREDAAGICKIAGNHAQAIVLIAGYFEHHLHVSLATYLQRLKDSPQMVVDLTDRLRPIEASQGVRLTFANSYAQLEEPAQQLFIALETSIFYTY